MFKNQKLRVQIVLAKVENVASAQKQLIVQKQNKKTEALEAELAAIKQA
jgi:hypothetical protein